MESKVENEMLSVKMRLTKAICWSHAKSGDDAEKLVSNDAKKSFAEAAQLLENVSEQSSKSFLIYETLKTKPQMRKKVYPVKEELFQELSKEIGKEYTEDNDELRNFAARLNRLQLEQLRKPRMRRLPRMRS